MRHYRFVREVEGDVTSDSTPKKKSTHHRNKYTIYSHYPQRVPLRLFPSSSSGSILPTTPSEPVLIPDRALAVDASLGLMNGVGSIPAEPCPAVLLIVRRELLDTLLPFPLAESCLLLLIERGSGIVLRPIVEAPELAARAVLEPVLLLSLSLACLRLPPSPWRLAIKASFISFKRSST